MKTILFFLLSSLMLLSITSCQVGQHWYRGNTHAHTEMSGHGDAKPNTVAQWYYDQGYHFLILSEHNHFIDPESIHFSMGKRRDFILIPGEEITALNDVHSTAMNINQFITVNDAIQLKSDTIQNHVDQTRSAGGQAILNHPNYKYTLQSSDILPVKNLYLLELYNGHPTANNFGDADNLSSEDLWDQLLSKGMRIYAVSSDDSHVFHAQGEEHSNPGRGWVMVSASNLSPQSITHAMLNGDFYASNGVMLKHYSQAKGDYQIQVDTQQTRQLVNSAHTYGKRVTAGDLGYTIEFIGISGKVLSSINSTEANFSVAAASGYVRAKVTYRHLHPERGLEEFYAWGQPLFTSTTN